MGVSLLVLRLMQLRQPRPVAIFHSRGPIRPGAPSLSSRCQVNTEKRRQTEIRYWCPVAKRATESVVLATFSTLSIAVACCQTPKQEQVIRDPSALAVLQRTWALMGGSTWATSPSLHISGTTDLDLGKSQSGTFLFEADSTGTTTTAFTDSGGNEMRYTVNATSAKVSRTGHSDATLAPHKVLNLPPYFPLSLVGQVLGAAQWSVVNQGSADVESIPCTVIEVRRVYPLSADPTQIMSRFTDRRLFIDSTAGLIRRIDYTTYSDNNIRISMPRTITFDNYRQFGPYQLAGTITDSVNGQVAKRILINSID